MNAPQINNGKKPFDYYNGLTMTHLPAKTPFGNLMAAKMFVDTRIDYVNLKLTKIYEPFPIKIEGIIPLLFPQLVDIPTEEVIYLIRRLTDDLICLWSILSNFSNSGIYGPKIAIDCVGGLLDQISQTGVPHEFYRNSEWLQNLNDVANAYKHSFAQTQLQQFSAQQPLVLAFAWKRNNTQNPVDTKLIPLSEIIAGYTLFYQQMGIWLRDWGAANPDCHQGKKYNS
jgi:hypothetical protein